jgi:hypothetical protein
VGGSRLDLVGVVSGDPWVEFGGRRRQILSCICGSASPMVVRGCRSLPHATLCHPTIPFPPCHAQGQRRCQPLASLWESNAYPHCKVTHDYPHCSHNRSILSLQNFFKFQIFSNESLVFTISSVNVRSWSFSHLPSHLSLLFTSEDIVLFHIFGLNVRFRLLAVVPIDTSS